MSCPVLSLLYFFFSQLCAGRTHGRILTIYGLNDASSPKDVPFRGLDDDPQYYGVQHLQKGGVVRHFPAKLVNL